MDVTHPKVKYHWFISMNENGLDDQKKIFATIKNLPKLVKISKKGLVFDRPFTPEFLMLLRRGPSLVCLRILFKLQGHANWKSFDIQRLWPAGTDFETWNSKHTGDLDNILATKELLFNLEDEGAQDFNFTFDQAKF